MTALSRGSRRSTVGHLLARVSRAQALLSEPTAHGLRRWRLELATGALTGVLTGVLAALHVVGGDDPAHLYRGYLAAHGLLVWDDYWYSGMSLPSYSLLFPSLSAVVGLVPLALVGGVAASALFALLLRTEYGSRAAVLPALSFAVLGGTTLLTGEFPFALAVCTALGALVCLQRNRCWGALGCVALTAGFSPLAFAMLVMILVATAGTHWPLHRPGWTVVVGSTAVAGLLGVAQQAFSIPGSLPFESRWLVWALVLNGIGILLTAPVRRARTMTAFFVLWTAACLFVYLVPDNPVGRNIVRPEMYGLPLLLLAGQLAVQATVRAQCAPRLRSAFILATGSVVVTSVVAATVYDAPLAALVPDGMHIDRSSSVAWSPAESFLESHASAQYRVEVVPTPGHWEAYWLADAGMALVRGWYRQSDLAYNAPANGIRVWRGAYLEWLHANAVRYVILPPHGVEAQGEAALLDSGRSGLRPVWTFRGWHAWAVPDPVGLLAGDRPARLTAYGHSTIRGWVSAPGRYTLRVHFNWYWTVRHGVLCTLPGRGGMTELVLHRGGAFTLTSQEHPWDLVGDGLDDDLAGC